MIDNFIGVFDNVLSKEHCEELIKVYEDCQALNYCINRQNLGKKKINEDTNLVFPIELFEMLCSKQTIA